MQQKSVPKHAPHSNVAIVDQGILVKEQSMTRKSVPSTTTASTAP